MSPSPKIKPETLEPVVFVIFGITGDLAQRYLLPALYHLARNGYLHHDTQIIGLSRRDVTSQELIDKIDASVRRTEDDCEQTVLKHLHSHLHMMQFHPGHGEDYDKLKLHLDTFQDSKGLPTKRLFYLSIPPTVYSTVIKHLGTHKLAPEGVGSLLVEKPFGYDLTSATELIDETGTYFKESQIYRIDHYLAKETAQNILMFRRHNPIFDAIWNGQHISKIEVTADEQIGIEDRGAFYDNIGALRDFTQSHLMQVLALTTLDLPESINDTSLHAAKRRLLDAIEPIPAAMVASRVKRGQYDGYRQAVGNPNSTTETYVSVELQIKNDRWHDTIIKLTTGKRLPKRSTFVRLTFSSPLNDTANQLTFRLQPNQGIDMNLQVKRPGFDEQMEAAVMDFDYRSAAHPDAYERVLVDAIRADHTLFSSSQEVLRSWQVLQPILDAWQDSDADLFIYKPGSEIAAD